MNDPLPKEHSPPASQKWLATAAGIGCGAVFCMAILCCGVIGMIGALNRSTRQQPNQESQSSLQSGGPYELKQAPTPSVDPELVMKLRSGMNEDQVQAILGRPHKKERREIAAIPALNEPAKVHVTWTYNSDMEGFIVLLFEDGLLCEGGTGGYNINTGIVLPDKIK